MPEHRTTGGAKEFKYDKEHLDKIRSTDTESTKAFKEAYSEWNKQRMTAKIEEQKIEAVMQHQRKVLLLITVGLVALMIILLLVYFL